MNLPFQNITAQDYFNENFSPEDRIIAQSPFKIEKILQSEVFTTLASTFKSQSITLYDLLILSGIALGLSANTSNLVLFTSDRREEAENFVLAQPEYDLIHTTPMGYALEMASLFNERACGKIGTELAYGFWNAASLKLVQNTQSNIITLIANLDNQTSTLWMLEILYLAAHRPNQKIALYSGALDQAPEMLEASDLIKYINYDLLHWILALQESKFDVSSETVCQQNLWSKFLGKDIPPFEQGSLFELRYFLNTKNLWKSLSQSAEILLART